MKIKIKSSNNFWYGNCASDALAAAFNSDVKVIGVLFTVMGISDWNRGVTFHQFQKVLNLLTTNRYVPNKVKLDYFQLAYVLKEESFFVHFPEHISFCKQGTIIDGYIKDNPQWLTKKPTGWWII